MIRYYAEILVRIEWPISADPQREAKRWLEGIISDAIGTHPYFPEAKINTTLKDKIAIAND